MYIKNFKPIEVFGIAIPFWIIATVFGTIAGLALIIFIISFLRYKFKTRKKKNSKKNQKNSNNIDKQPIEVEISIIDEEIDEVLKKEKQNHNI
ncbi:TIGR04561 family membrane protein [Mycoplasma mycoides subsp. capri]|uniref:TIGR04561 family membrane protein n=1 Tax=Mycoplasma mycoides TaxID=2102 RepID=UPI002240D58C|nr:TIGR04561 family membrane protein [Mycoplasma mycoides]QVK02327.1 TIGR04561 family membrane protein [Mycoplasma mycoides subsp. capri]